MKSNNAILPRVLLITTGGTISMLDSPDGVLMPSGDAQPFSALMPELSRLARVDAYSLGDMDSANLEPTLWLDLLKVLDEHWEDYDGFLITHGTDTMVYTAAGLSFFIHNPDKPIVLTGAQVPLIELGSDGRANLINALRVAVSDLAEVCITFGSLVIRGTRARKVSAFDLQAFRSVNDGPLGTIGLILRLVPGAHRRHHQGRPLLTPHLCPEVARIPVWPGMQPDILRYLASKHRGLVVEGYGVGSIPSLGDASVVPAIREATQNGVPVVVTTQCMVGATAMERYQVGRAALEAGAIPAMDMTPECAQVKLMWALGQSRDLAEIKAIISKNYTGEVSEWTI